MRFLFCCLHGPHHTKKCSEAVPEDLSDLARVNLTVRLDWREHLPERKKNFVKNPEACTP